MVLWWVVSRLLFLNMLLFSCVNLGLELVGGLIVKLMCLLGWMSSRLLYLFVL